MSLTKEERGHLVLHAASIEVTHSRSAHLIRKTLSALDAAERRAAEAEGDTRLLREYGRARSLLRADMRAEPGRGAVASDHPFAVAQTRLHERAIALASGSGGNGGGKGGGE